MIKLSTIIKETRLNKNITQQHLADMVDCSRNHLSKIERGEIYPSGHLLERILDKLEIKITAFDTNKNEFIQKITPSLKWLTTDDLDTISDLIKIRSIKRKNQNKLTKKRSRNKKNPR